jgi:toxin ParE1/3/4
VARLTWTNQALDDLDAICSFIGRDAPRYAQSFAARVLQATERLAQFPNSGRMVPEFGDPELREIIVQSYRVIYRVWSDEAEIITVHHGARRLQRLNGP